MIKRLLVILIPVFGFSQGYTSYFTGNPTNITTTTEFGVCLMGGATEHDNAMIWLLQKANHGDIVILRSSGSDGYNDYLYSGLGVSVNSVETLVITSVAGATNPYVLDKVANAEMIWFAGGDQWNYISYFKDNALEDLINAHVNVKNAPIGGTSAGMAILGGQYFSAENGTVTSAQAMNNPYASNVTLDGFNLAGAPPTLTFLNIPFMRRVITDTHYDNPDRRGRHATFLARIKVINGFTNTYGIACNEYVAVCIGADGIAHVYGDYPNYQEFAYFIQPNCLWWNTVENCTAGQPLTWNFGGAALKAYKVPGTMNGTNYFDVNNWESGIGLGGSWENWSVNNGVFAAVPGDFDSMGCLLNNPDVDENRITLYPNPVKNTLYLDGLMNAKYSIYDAQGRFINVPNNFSNEINVASLSSGIYLIKITTEGKTSIKKFIKE